MNPVRSIWQTGNPITFFHTRVVTEDLLRQVINEGKSIELDISSGANGSLYIGHHKLFYEFEQIPKPKNISVEGAIEILSNSDVFIKFDCKDKNVLARVEKIIKKIGRRDRCMLHAFVPELDFTSCAAGVAVGLQWQQHEYIPLDDMVKLKKGCADIPLQVSCRALSKAQVLKDKLAIVDEIIRSVRKKAEVVNFNLPDNEPPPNIAISKLYNAGLLTEIRVENLIGREIGLPYFGVSDYLERVSAFP